MIKENIEKILNDLKFHKKSYDDYEKDCLSRKTVTRTRFEFKDFDCIQKLDYIIQDFARKNFNYIIQDETVNIWKVKT